TAGSNKPMRTAMIAITTRSSINVNPTRRRRGIPDLLTRGGPNGKEGDFRWSLPDVRVWTAGLPLLEIKRERCGIAPHRGANGRGFRFPIDLGNYFLLSCQSFTHLAATP